MRAILLIALLISLHNSSASDSHPCTDVLEYIEELAPQKVPCYNSILELSPRIQALDVDAVHFLSNTSEIENLSRDLQDLIEAIKEVQEKCDAHLTPIKAIQGEYDSNYCQENIKSMLIITPEIRPDPSLDSGLERFLEFYDYLVSAARTCGWKTAIPNDS